MAEKQKTRKIYVLDTSVILYDSDAIKNFEENDIAIPITVLEELDKAAKAGKGAASLDGKLIDAASARMAENIVRQADAIEANKR